MHYLEIMLAELLADRSLKPVDRAVFLAIYDNPAGSLRELAELTGISRRGLRPVCARLAEAGWAQLSRVGRRHECVKVVSAIPAACQTKQLKALQEEHSMVANRGELLMKRQLDLRVRDRRFVDNARPPELAQPGDGHRLECDRLYLDASVGFEFSGLYHHDPEEGASPETVAEISATQTRDLIKIGLCAKAGLKLVTVGGPDLSFERFAQLIPAELPLREVDPEGLYYHELARMCKAYADLAVRAKKDGGRRGGR